MNHLSDLKSISLIIAIMMVLQLILPYSFAEADVDSMSTYVIPVEKITKVAVSAENNDGVVQNIEDIENYRPQNGV